MVVVAVEDLVKRGRTASRNGRDSRYRHSLLRIADDRGRWTAIAADVSVGIPLRPPPNDAWASRVLVCELHRF